MAQEGCWWNNGKGGNVFFKSNNSVVGWSCGSFNLNLKFVVRINETII